MRLDCGASKGEGKKLNRPSYESPSREFAPLAKCPEERHLIIGAEPFDSIPAGDQAYESSTNQTLIGFVGFELAQLFAFWHRDPRSHHTLEKAFHCLFSR